MKALAGSGVPVASVATGFPAGLTPLPLRLAEIRYAVEQGAGEIDIVITRAHVLNRDWAALYDEVKAMREACGEAHLKAILATGADSAPATKLDFARRLFARDCRGRRLCRDLSQSQ